ncbi:hypothetical protein GY45DRAFT_1146737 [Cubamyces sp. BRFM 1775]|nr:hypothetical protein GY45DRAFT_1146737 [Cubamyces sp. BRFM 1775]
MQKSAVAQTACHSCPRFFYLCWERVANVSRRLLVMQTAQPVQSNNVHHHQLTFLLSRSRNSFTSSSVRLFVTASARSRAPVAPSLFFQPMSLGRAAACNVILLAALPPGPLKLDSTASHGIGPARKEVCICCASGSAEGASSRQIFGVRRGGLRGGEVGWTVAAGTASGFA